MKNNFFIIRVLCCFVAAFLFATFAAAAQTNSTPLPDRVFAHPDRVRYDGHCMTIDGKDVFIYSGAFHYFRCPKELWRDRFQKIHDAGFNAVESYVPWNWHEMQKPDSLQDFSKINLTDLDDWLKMAEEFHLYVIIRPGPYICAEWDTGAYPQWLLTLKPAQPLRDKAWLRTDDPVYLDWCKHWYDAVCPVIAPHQITRRNPGEAGVILFQLENEYDFPHLPADVMLRQLKALGEAARADGIDVPFITCWTHPVRGAKEPLMREVFDSCNFYPRWDVDGLGKDMAKLRLEQPDAPLMTTELQGGWFANVGGKLSEEQDGVTASQINNLTLFVIQNGETVMNYYMLFGGTNPGDRAARGLLTSYDYNAPIREWGGVGDRYQRVWALGHMLREHGARLARAEAVPCSVVVPQKDVTVVMRRAQDGGRYLFIRTSQHTEPRMGTARVTPKTGSENQEIVFDYSLEPFGAKVLYLPPGVNNADQGEWLPKPAPEIVRPANLPPGVVFTSALRRADPGPVNWSPLKAGENLAQAGVYDSRFVFYRGSVSNAVATNLLVEHFGGDAVLATINGQPPIHATNAGSSSIFSLPAGSNEAVFLYENPGHGNYGGDMEHPCGIIAARLSPSTFGTGKSITGWRKHEVKNTDPGPEIEAGFNDSDWASVNVDSIEADNLPSGETAVYRATVDMDTNDLQGGNMILNLGRVDDSGWVFVNGEKIGETTDWASSYSFDVTQHLRAGHNSIAVIIKNSEGAGGLGMPTIGHESREATMQLDSIGSPGGFDEQWWNPSLDDRSWQPFIIGAENPPNKQPLLTWYRFKFELAPIKIGVWVPWRLHLFATGNGFLYLNGHPLGRYWEAGPQHDFFLPDCWLNFGAGQQNVVTLNLRPGGKGATIQSATVQPYADFAETR